MQDNSNRITTNDSATRKKPNAAVTSPRTAKPVAKKNNAISAKRANNLRAKRTLEVVNVNKKDKAPFPWSVVVVAVIMTGLFLFMMMNYAEVDKYRSEINDLNGDIETMKKTQNDLNVTLSDKYDLADVKDYAENELGMVDGAGLEKNYITNRQEDKTEMNNYDDGEEGGFGFLLTGLGEVIRDFID